MGPAGRVHRVYSASWRFYCHDYGRPSRDSVGAAHFVSATSFPPFSPQPPSSRLVVVVYQLQTVACPCIDCKHRSVVDNHVKPQKRQRFDISLRVLTTFL